MPEGHPDVHPRCPESPDVVPLCQMVAVPVLQRLYSWFGLFVCNDDLVCFTLSCDGLLAVFVTIYCFKVYFTVYFIVLVD